MASHQTLPRDDNAVMLTIHEKDCDLSGDPKDEESMRSSCGKQLGREWGARWSASPVWFAALVLGGALSLLWLALKLGVVSDYTIAALGRVAVFLWVYVMAAMALVRVFQWLDGERGVRLPETAMQKIYVPPSQSPYYQCSQA